MRFKSATIKDFKRFTNLRVQGIPDTARLIVLAGPNGCGQVLLLRGTVKLSRICPFCGRILLDQRLRINDLAVAAGGENAAKLLNLTVPFEVPVRAWGRVGFHNHRPAPRGVVPVQIISAGRR